MHEHCCILWSLINKGILGIKMRWMWRMLRWALLIAVTVAVTIPLTRIGVPSAGLFAALVVGVVLALTSLAPPRIPHKAGIAAQGVLGVYIGTMVHQDAVGAVGGGAAVHGGARAGGEGEEGQDQTNGPHRCGF